MLNHLLHLNETTITTWFKLNSCGTVWSNKIHSVKLKGQGPGSWGQRRSGPESLMTVVKQARYQARVSVTVWEDDPWWDNPCRLMPLAEMKRYKPLLYCTLDEQTGHLADKRRRMGRIKIAPTSDPLDIASEIFYMLEKLKCRNEMMTPMMMFPRWVTHQIKSCPEREFSHKNTSVEERQQICVGEL